jgi:hypothetical protein
MLFLHFCPTIQPFKLTFPDLMDTAKNLYDKRGGGAYGGEASSF